MVVSGVVETQSWCGCVVCIGNCALLLNIAVACYSGADYIHTTKPRPFVPARLALRHFNITRHNERRGIIKSFAVFMASNMAPLSGRWPILGPTELSVWPPSLSLNSSRHVEQQGTTEAEQGFSGTRVFGYLVLGYLEFYKCLLAGLCLPVSIGSWIPFRVVLESCDPRSFWGQEGAIQGGRRSSRLRLTP
ncbi:hypothetical protein E2C01_045221 [Portunus trituberculatus]|uniref:Uncharacterized protein n=1 Tax=Portunus trituberculatus TaxID=210409 RepID=A0A5B7G1F2_PORTR|nr:hypothetical protein [Portunus trituberculatus]